MKAVNYVTQIERFIALGVEREFSPYERALWLGIFTCANQIAKRNVAHLWPDGFFTITTSRMKSFTGMNARAVRNCRKKLRDEYHLIDYIDGDGRKSQPRYKIHYLTEINGRIVPEDVAKCDSDNVTNNASDYICDKPLDDVKNIPNAVCDKSAEAHVVNSPSTSIDVGNTDIYADAGATNKPNSTSDNLFGFPGLIDLDTSITDMGLIP